MGVVIAEVAAAAAGSKHHSSGSVGPHEGCGASASPVVDKSLPNDLRSTLRSCWSQQPEQRPTADRMNILLTELLGDIDSSGSSSDEAGSADEVMLDQQLRNRRQSS